MRRFHLFVVDETTFEIWNGQEESRYEYGGNYAQYPIFERQTIRVETYVCDVTINPANPDNIKLLAAIDLNSTQSLDDWKDSTTNERLVNLMAGYYGSEYRFAEILEVTL